jgi:hypothetical protein
MKANLDPYIDNRFFLRYCAPIAIASYLVIAWQLRRRLRGEHVNLETMDVLDSNAQDVRFLQAMRHGEVLTPIEFVENHAGELGGKTDPVVERLREGESIGVALVREEVTEVTRRELLGRFLSEDLAESLDNHYVLQAVGDQAGALAAQRQVDRTLAASARRRKIAQRLGALALIPFIGMLVWHGLDHRVPLFLASFAGFFVALLGIAAIPKMRALSLSEASHEYAEYYFLFPLFLSITLLTEAGFFDQIQYLVRHGTETLGPSHVAFAQFIGSSGLSAILDNNVVADFASRALHGLPVDVMHLFAMAQIAGYALGGCWTHIGSAQSVVAFAFIRRDIDEDYTPVQWIKEMTPIVVQLLLLITVLIYLEGALFSLLSYGSRGSESL